MLSGANVEYDLPIPIKDESETLSDIDDAELDVYIHNEEEKNMKKTLWAQHLLERTFWALVDAAGRELGERREAPLLNVRSFLHHQPF